MNLALFQTEELISILINSEEISSWHLVIDQLIWNYLSYGLPSDPFDSWPSMDKGVLLGIIMDEDGA